MIRLTRWRLYLFSLIVFLAAAIGAYHWRFGGTLADNPPANNAPSDAVKSAESAGTDAKAESITVTSGEISRTILVTGELKASRSRDIIAPEVRSQFGTSITFMALEGTEVKKGDRILEFDASGLLSQKSEAQRILDEAKLRIEKTKADMEIQRTDLLIEVSNSQGNLKVAQLYAKIEKGLLPANTFQKYQLDLEKAQLALSKANERLANLVDNIPAQIALVEVDRDQAEINLKKIEGDLALMSVDAPQDGIIIYGDNWANNRKFQVGDNAFRGMPVMTLPDLSSMQVVANVYDTELRFLSPNMACDLSLDAVPGKSWKGRITSITSVANKKSFASLHKVFKAVIDLERVDLDVMKPGMTVKVEVPVSLASQIISIPREFIGVDAQGKFYVHKGADPKTVQKKVVEVGIFSDRAVQVVSGLSVGDRLLPVQNRAEAKE